MGRQSLVLLSKPTATLIYTSPPIRVDNWYSNANHLHTIQIVASNFRGLVSIEASIMNNPTDRDWFYIPLNDHPYVEYPRSLDNTIRAYVPIDLNNTGTGINAMGETSTVSFNFTGRFVWMRAKVDRSTVVPSDASPLMIAQVGVIDRILLNI